MDFTEKLIKYENQKEYNYLINFYINRGHNINESIRKNKTLDYNDFIIDFQKVFNDKKLRLGNYTDNNDITVYRCVNRVKFNQERTFVSCSLKKPITKFGSFCVKIIISKNINVLCAWLPEYGHTEIEDYEIIFNYMDQDLILVQDDKNDYIYKLVRRQDVTPVDNKKLEEMRHEMYKKFMDEDFSDED
jgi:hypothetical protein